MPKTAPAKKEAVKAPPKKDNSYARVVRLREAREKSGFKRLDLYAHPDNHGEIKTYAAMLEIQRQERLEAQATKA